MWTRAAGSLLVLDTQFMDFYGLSLIYSDLVFILSQVFPRL